MDLKVFYADLLNNPAIWEVFENEYLVRKKEQKREKLYFLKQKGMGVLALTISIVIPFLLDGDVTASMIFAPIGAYLLGTKEKIMDL